MVGGRALPPDVLRNRLTGDQQSSITEFIAEVEGSLLDVGVELGIVKKSGAWYTYEGEQLGQGRENAKTFLAENLDMMLEISEKIRQEVGIEPVEVADIDVTEDEPVDI